MPFEYGVSFFILDLFMKILWTIRLLPPQWYISVHMINHAYAIEEVLPCVLTHERRDSRVAARACYARARRHLIPQSEKSNHDNHLFASVLGAHFNGAFKRLPSRGHDLFLGGGGKIKWIRERIWHRVATEGVSKVLIRSQWEVHLECRTSREVIKSD